VCLLYMSSFFFSSRRRHTRSKRDWSSDVCSSDLCGSWCWSWLVSMVRDICVFEHVRGCGRACWPSSGSPGCLLVGDLCVFTGVRSEERRVGKECGYRVLREEG